MAIARLDCSLCDILVLCWSLFDRGKVGVSYLVKRTNLDGLMHQAKCVMAWLMLSHFPSDVDAQSETSEAGSVSRAI